MRTLTMLFVHLHLLVITIATGTTHAAVDAVFTSTNEVAGNMAVMYKRAPSGKLSFVGEFATGGTGTGGGLGNQGAVILTNDGDWLLVVNAGSNNITVFDVDSNGLTVVDVEPSGGVMPISLTMFGDLVYVLNAGGAGNITGFTLEADGDLVALPGSTRPLSGAKAPMPAQVEFSPDGNLLVVTEKATNLIVVYQVAANGLPGDPIVQPSNGMTPFGFAFTPNGRLIVSEAFGGAPDASAVSSYSVSAAGAISVISGSVPTTETAACWIVITNSGRFTYTTNTGSGTITGYAISATGALTILDADGVTAQTGRGSAPTDLALSSNSRFLYALNSGTGEIVAFRVNQQNGGLKFIEREGGLPANSTGLAAR